MVDKSLRFEAKKTLFFGNGAVGGGGGVFVKDTLDFKILDGSSFELCFQPQKPL